MELSKTFPLKQNNKELTVVCAVLNGGSISPIIIDDIKKAFKTLAPYLKYDNQVLYIRDIKTLAIKQKYPGGHCYNPYEAMIALVSWSDDEQKIRGIINHELHHMARWQNAGYGDTLGGAILSEGIATYYEESQSGRLYPWAKVSVSEEVVTQALKEWNSKDYNHGEWFFNGPYGEWVGYSIGYQLAKLLFKDGFDLAMSLKVRPNEVVNFMEQLLEK